MVIVQSKAYSSQISPNCSVTVHDQPLFKWDFNVVLGTRSYNCLWQWGSWCYYQGGQSPSHHFAFHFKFEFITALCQCNLAKWQKAWDHTQGKRLQVLKPVVCPLRSSCHLTSLYRVMVNHLQSPVPAQQSATVFLGNHILFVPHMLVECWRYVQKLWLFHLVCIISEIFCNNPDVLCQVLFF